MKVSIVIPFYKNIGWLKEALDSIKNQNFEDDFEVLVIDDGSDEDSKSILKEYNFNFQFLKVENGGAAIARNHGIRLAKGEFIAFLDSDDLWLEDKLKLQVNFMEENNLVWSHTGFINFFDRTGDTINSVMPINFKGEVFLKGLVSCPIATPTVMVKRDILIKEGLHFHPKMRQGQDTFLWYSLSELFPLGYINRALVKVRIRDNNTSMSVSNHLRVKAQIWSFFVKRRSSIPLRIKLPYWLAYINYYIIGKFFERNASKGVNEFVSKILYALPYLLLRIQK